MLSLVSIWDRINYFSRTLLFVMVLGYFVYHAISGERGLLALLQYSQKIEKAQESLDILRADRLGLEHRTHLMHSESLDKDLLDEQARRILGYASKNEMVFVRDGQ